MVSGPKIDDETLKSVVSALGKVDRSVRGSEAALIEEAAEEKHARGII